MVHPFALDGRAVIVTGAGRGNGRAIAEGLSNLGVKVFGFDIRFEGGEAPFSQTICDITDESSVEDAFEEVVKRASRLDGLVNNAGITMPAADCYSAASFQKTMSVNTLAPLRLGWRAAEYMKTRSCGSIVNITSLGSHLGFPDNPSYQASKAALRQLTKSMAMDYGQFGIRVNSICPGYILTDMTKGSYEDPVKRKARTDRMMLPRWGTPADLVGPCAFLLSDASAYITGVDIAVDGGWLAKGF
jgi:NAD(P)-dependent dehydrogenase (short-subunit alcohol dehydrogenase family)